MFSVRSAFLAFFDRLKIVTPTLTFGSFPCIACFQIGNYFSQLSSIIYPVAQIWLINVWSMWFSYSLVWFKENNTIIELDQSAIARVPTIYSHVWFNIKIAFNCLCKVIFDKNYFYSMHTCDMRFHFHFIVPSFIPRINFNHIYFLPKHRLPIVLNFASLYILLTALFVETA